MNKDIKKYKKIIDNLPKIEYVKKIKLKRYIKDYRLIIYVIEVTYINGIINPIVISDNNIKNSEEFTKAIIKLIKEGYQEEKLLTFRERKYLQQIINGIKQPIQYIEKLDDRLFIKDKYDELICNILISYTKYSFDKLLELKCYSLEDLGLKQELKEEK